MAIVRVLASTVPLSRPCPGDLRLGAFVWDLSMATLMLDEYDAADADNDDDYEHFSQQASRWDTKATHAAQLFKNRSRAQVTLTE